MDNQCVANFIAGATKQPCPKDDNRVATIVNTYDKNKDGLLDINDFLRFYQVAASGNNIDQQAAYDKLINAEVRLPHGNDYKKATQ